MENPGLSVREVAENPRRPNALRRAMENPVIIKELRGRMRGRQAFVLLTLYVGFISLVIAALYNTAATDVGPTTWDPDFRQTMGKVIFGAVVILELLLVSFIAPALTAGAITSERERQTFDLLRTTTLPARALVLGKLGAALAYVLLLILAALPIESITFMLGGVALEEILVSSLMLVVTAVYYCTLGLFFSSFMKRTAGASVAAYVVILLSYVLLALMAFVWVLPGMASGTFETSRSYQVFMNVVLWILISTNPLLAAIISEVNLVEDQNLFQMTLPLSSKPDLILPSPWIAYVVICLIITAIMIYMSVQLVRRPDR